jgi:hypothetical protein
VLPGDEMRVDESAAETIARFGSDQLDIRAGAEAFVDTLYLAEAGDSYAVNVFRLESYDGRPRFRESGPYTDVRWVPLEEIAAVRGYEMPPALRDVLTQSSERSAT